MDLSSLLQDITDYKGWLSGSYVRDVIKDIDFLIPFYLNQNAYSKI